MRRIDLTVHRAEPGLSEFDPHVILPQYLTCTEANLSIEELAYNMVVARRIREAGDSIDVTDEEWESIMATLERPRGYNMFWGEMAIRICHAPEVED